MATAGACALAVPPKLREPVALPAAWAAAEPLNVREPVAVPATGSTLVGPRNLARTTLWAAWALAPYRTNPAMAYSSVQDQSTAQSCPVPDTRNRPIPAAAVAGMISPEPLGFRGRTTPAPIAAGITNR